MTRTTGHGRAVTTCGTPRALRLGLEVRGARAQRRARAAVLALVGTACLAAAPGDATASGPAVVLIADPRVDDALRQGVQQVVSTKRVVRPLRPMPAAATESPEQAANAARVKAIELALSRARQSESEAAWDACATEAAGVLGDAIELLASSTEFALLRDLHVQIGACMSLGPSPADASPHFLAATLLDEQPPETGRHREEAERAQARSREEVLARSLGNVTIESDPPGADVWIDGRHAAGVTPVAIPVRLGDHFVTLRRFRFETRTERRVLQPGSRAHSSLEPARTETLREQLAEVAAGTRRVSSAELRLGRAAWSHASQIIGLAPVLGPTSAVRLTLEDAATGTVLRTAVLPSDADEDVVRDSTCGLLGEVCEPPEAGIPWYVWPITGVAVIGAAIAIGFIADSARPTLFCPSTGCD
jgi:hypothetical protein